MELTRSDLDDTVSLFPTFQISVKEKIMMIQLNLQNWKLT